MKSILLVRHAEPRVVPARKARTWELTCAGRSAARDIATRLIDHRPDIVVTSREVKARETGAIITAALCLPMREHEGLGEQGGDNVAFFRDRDVFREVVQHHFSEPSRILLGQESAREAAARFAGVVAELAGRSPGPRCPVLVSHGRVMASYLALATGADAWTVWNTLAFPDASALDLESRSMRRLLD